jgi:phage terminase large subunit
LDSLPTLPSQQFDLIIPYRYEPRPYQLPILKALDSGIKRAVAVWHRRAGKEKTFINYTAKACFQRVGTYFYIFPTYSQAKKVLWDGRDRDGFAFMDHFPREIVAKSNETEMRKELINGSAVQLVGSDNIDSILGTNPVGCVFSEYALQDPKAWDYMRPILRENGGWAIFDYTPRGKNHGYSLYQMAKANPDWYAEILTVNDTHALTDADINAERAAGMSEELIQQEFYCSFEGVLSGSVFGKAMQEAEAEGRICAVPWQSEFSVDTWWDIGTGDATAIWFTQNAGREVHVIDYYENSGSGIGIDHYVKKLHELPYVYGKHNGPHDIDSHQFAANGKSTREQALNLGLKFEDDTGKKDGLSTLNAARSFIRRCWFDRVKTERGRDALMSYHYKWDDNRKKFGDEPYHDWSSNGADAFQYLSILHKFAEVKKRPVIEIIGAYDKDAMAQQWMGA